MTEQEAKERVIIAGKKLVESGLIARTWGNVSCRIDEYHFAITPSGRDYMSLTPDQIVTVAIADCSYAGNVKPSSEKGIHADVYKNKPDVNFVIHTHQENASVISALGLDKIQIGNRYPLLGEEIICASYGLPGTKKLLRGVSEAIKYAKGNGVIMKHHGAVCFGKDDEEAFRAASDLEAACENFINNQYKQVSQIKEFHPDQLRQFALTRLTQKKTVDAGQSCSYCDSERTENGFKLYRKDGSTVQFKLGHHADSILEEAKLYNEIYEKNRNINYIIYTDVPDILTTSSADLTLYPYLDDFAQIVGTKVHTVAEDESKISAALRSASAVLIKNHGALCCGSSKGDASAVSMIMEKNCKVVIAGTIFGKITPIGWLDKNLMRFVYLKKYAKQISK